jgi:hypothetical protein
VIIAASKAKAKQKYLQLVSGVSAALQKKLYYTQVAASAGQ